MSSNLTADWRATQQQTSAGSKRLQGYLLLVLTLFLVGLLAWWLWPNSSARTHLVLCRVEGYDPIDLPKLFYAEQDHSKLGVSLSPSSQIGSFRLTQVEQFSKFGAEINKVLPEKPSPKKDVLIIDLCCHTATYAGKAYLLGSQFNNHFSDQEEINKRGLASFTGLLDTVKTLPFKHKLILLDSSRLSPSPWLGTLVDEFPWLVSNAMEAQDDSNLWVVTSTGPHQTSRFSHVLGRSIFGLALEDALSHNADANQDNALTLHEFFKHLHDTSEKWSERRQAPQLYRGGKGLCDSEDQKGFVLAYLAPMEIAEEELDAENPAATDDPSDDDKTGVDTDMEAKATEAKENEQGQEGLAKNGASAADENPQPVTIQEYLWTMRDSLQTTGENKASAKVLPLSCAPQLWRRINLGLVRLDQAAQDEPAPLPNHLPFQGNVAQTYQQFQEWVVEQGEALAILRESTQQLNKLFNNETHRLQKQEAWTRSHPIVQQRRQWLHAYCQALFNAPYYLQYFDRASQTAEVDSDDLDLYLSKLQTIKQLLNKPADRSNQACLERLEQEMHKLSDIEDELYNTLLNRLKKAKKRLYEECQLGHWSYVMEQQLQDLLAVPLLRAQDRNLARAAILEASGVFRRFEKQQLTPHRESPQAANNMWEVAIRRARWHAKLVGVTSPARENAMTELLVDMSDERTGNASQFRDMGKILHDHYGQLAQAPAPQGRKTVASGDFQQNLMARLADGRDYRPESRLPIGLPKPNYLSGTIAPEATISLAPASLPIGQGHSGLLKVTAIAGGEGLRGIVGIVSHQNSNLKVVLNAGRSKPIQIDPGKRFLVPYKPIDRFEHPFSLSFTLGNQLQVEANPDPIRVTLEIRNTSTPDTMLASKEILLFPPGTDVFQVTAEQKVLLQGNITWKNLISEEDQRGPIRLKAFPARENIFRFGLRNKTSVPKKIQARLHLVRDAQNNSSSPVMGSVFNPHGTFPAPSYKRWLDELRHSSPGKSPHSIVAFTSEPIELAVHARVHWLRLIPGAPAQKNDADKSETSSEDKAPLPAPPEFPLALPKGLLLEIRDITTGIENVQSTFRWIEFRPKRPLEYVVPEVRVDQLTAQILLRLDEGKVLPHNLFEQPVKVRWHAMPKTANAFEGISTLEVALQGTSNGQIDAVFANARGQRPPLVLDVDGYPKAFRFEAETGSNYQRNSARRSLQITRLSKTESDQGEPQDKEPHAATPQGTQAHPYLFSKATSLEATLEVEVPDNWRGDAGDYVQLERVRGSAGRRSSARKIVSRSYSEVSFHTKLLGIDTSANYSEIAVQLEVMPLRMPAFPLRSGDFNGKLRASLVWDEEPQEDSTSSVWFAVDTKSPSYESIRFESKSVILGEQATLVVKPNDGSSGTGVTRIQYLWVDRNGIPGKEEKKSAKAVFLRKGERLSLSTEKLKAGRQNYLAVNLIDKVGHESGWILSQSQESRRRISLEVRSKRPKSPKRKKRKKATSKKPVKAPPERMGLRVKLVYLSGKKNRRGGHCKEQYGSYVEQQKKTKTLGWECL